MAEIEETWSLAIGIDGELHVVIDAELPAASNVVRLRVRRDGDFIRFSKADMPALRRLIGTETREVLVLSGPAVADELESMLDKISSMMQARIDELSGDAEVPPAIR